MFRFVLFASLFHFSRFFSLLLPSICLYAIVAAIGFDARANPPNQGVPLGAIADLFIRLLCVSFFYYTARAAQLGKSLLHAVPHLPLAPFFVQVCNRRIPCRHFATVMIDLVCGKTGAAGDR